MNECYMFKKKKLGQLFQLIGFVCLRM